MNLLSDKHRGYVVGLFDGEGSCGVNKHSQSRGIPSYTVDVGIANTNKDVLIWLETSLGIGKIAPIRKQKEIHKQAWEWSLVYEEMPEFLKMVHEDSIIKQERIELVLEFLETCNGQPRLKGTGHRGGQAPSIELQIKRELIYRELRVLNKRGL